LFEFKKSTITAGALVLYFITIIVAVVYSCVANYFATSPNLDVLLESNYINEIRFNLIISMQSAKAP